MNGEYIVIPHDKAVFKISFLFRLYNVLKRIKPNIVHSHFDSANVHVAFVAKLISFEQVYWHQRNLFGNKLNHLRNFVYRKLSKNVTKIIAVSKSVKLDLESRGIKSEKISVIHNGIKIVQSYKNTNIRSELNLKKEDKIILTVAQARPEKDLDTLINSIPLLQDVPNLTFLIVGGGVLVDDLKLKAKDKEISNLVFLEKRNDIPDIMRKADLFILPSKKEGLGNVIAEAMVNRLPVIATNAGGIPELVISDETGWQFRIGDEVELSNHIRKFLNEKTPSQINEITSNAFSHINNYFNLDKKVKYTFKYLYKV